MFHAVFVSITQEMFNRNDLELVSGPVQFAHQLVDMPKYQVEVNDPVEGLTNVILLQNVLCRMNDVISH